MLWYTLCWNHINCYNYNHYPRRLCWSAWVERSRPSVCLFVCPQHPKRMISKSSNLVQGMILGYPRSDMVSGWKVKVRARLRVEQTAWIRTTWVPISLYVYICAGLLLYNRPIVNLIRIINNVLFRANHSMCFDSTFSRVLLSLWTTIWRINNKLLRRTWRSKRLAASSISVKQGMIKITALIVCDLARKMVQILGFSAPFVLGALRKGSVED